MDLLITASYPPAIWEYSKKEAKQIEFYDFSVYKLIPKNTLDIGILPRELATPILTYLFRIYLRERDYNLALSCCKVDTYHLQYFYGLVYRKSHQTNVELFRRISRTLLFCESIDDYICAPCFEFQCLALRLARPGRPGDDRPLRPWQFGAYNLTEGLEPNFSSGFETIHTVHTGENVADVVWLKGGFHRNGIFKAESIYHPVINLILCDAADTLLALNKNMVGNVYFQRFFDLLKIIYGPRLLVNYMIKEDDNPFIILTEAFINFY